jgi:predicted Zn-dependent protease
MGVLLAASLATGAHGATPISTLADDRLEASYNESSQFVHDAELDRLLAQVARQVQTANPDAACMPLRIHALDQPLAYDFVLKNGAFYLSTGLIARLQSEPEFAALIALPLAALCRGDADKLQSDQHQRVVNNFVPNLLLITLTAGFAAPSITKGNANHESAERDQLRDASDAVALHWLAAAGYSPGAAPLALTHLLDGLAAEHRSGTPEFSNPTELTSRRAALEKALAQSESAPPTPATPAAAAAPAPAKDPYHLLARRYALNLARADLDSHPLGFASWIDRIDTLDAPNGYTAYLRAEFARRNSGSDNGVPAAIASYEKCVAFADAPAVAYRELGFLYRQAGDQSRARAALDKYLQKAPTAVDAPIIRTLLEAP